jgi:hypothetical protein
MVAFIPAHVADQAGLRLSEALALEWREIDFKEKKIRVRYQLRRNEDKRVKLKSGAGQRDVIMMPALASVLRAHKVGSRHSQDGSRVFATASGRSVSQRNATRSFEAAGAEQGQGRHVPRAPPYLCVDVDRPGRRPGVRRRPARPQQTIVHAEHLRPSVPRGSARAPTQKQLQADYGALLRGASKGASNS